MTNMIISTYDLCEIGTIVEGDYRRNRNEEYNCNLFILREATYEEWKEYRLNNNLDIWVIDERFKKAYYYEVSTD